MSFSATVYNVMIASPSDVPEERQAVREVIYEWNALHADERKQVLLPVGWETHSAPDMKGPAQSIINEQVLHQCDILVGIFWTRIGTATAEYASGAVEEIQLHIAAGKPTMLYFSEALVKQEVIIGKQYRQLQKFKSFCRPRGLYESYSNIEDFKKKFNRQLQIIIKQHFISSPNEESPIKVPLAFEMKLAEDKNVLTTDEQNLLKATSLDKRGVIHRIKVSDGTYIETHNIHFVLIQSAREIARWDAAIESLLNKELIKMVGYEGDVFEITAAGFEVADKISETV